MGKKYEAGMRVTFDDKTGVVAIAFRGQLKTLAGPFLTKEAGIRAGEDDCRRRGWVDRSDDRAGLSMLNRNK